MSSINYPFDQDKQFQSFIITDKTIVTSVLGKTFSQQDLVVPDYAKMNAEFIAGTLTFLPLKVYSYISDAYRNDFISDEKTNDYQSINIANAIKQLWNYWKDDIINNTKFQFPMGIVTDIQQVLHQDGGGAGAFHIETKLFVTWFTSFKYA